MMHGERRLDLGTIGGWLLVLSLFAGLWRVWHTGQVCQQAMARQAHLYSQITHFQREIAHCERLIVSIGASQSEVVRTSGANPATLRQQLKVHLASAAHNFHALRTMLEPLLKQAGASEAMHWTVARVEAEWLQVYSNLQEYLARDEGNPLNLDTLHTFYNARQDNLYAALASLHRSATDWHHAQMRELSRQRGLAIGLCFLATLLLVGWGWYFAIRPAQLMSRWQPTLEPLGRDEGVIRKLRGTRWEPLAHTLQQQRQRLREVERFIRDLAMGRTPEPLQPLEPNDPLARSSFWLLRRIEEHRRSRSEREVV